MKELLEARKVVPVIERRYHYVRLLRLCGTLKKGTHEEKWSSRWNRTITPHCKSQHIVKSIRKGNKNYGQSSTLRPARASAAATGSMASATIASVAARMAGLATTHAATLYSISRTGTCDGYGAAEKLACNSAAMPISRHPRYASLLYGARC